jgi:hypothetical protein
VAHNGVRAGGDERVVGVDGELEGEEAAQAAVARDAEGRASEIEQPSEEKEGRGREEGNARVRVERAEEGGSPGEVFRGRGDVVCDDERDFREPAAPEASLDKIE